MVLQLVNFSVTALASFASTNKFIPVFLSAYICVCFLSFPLNWFLTLNWSPDYLKSLTCSHVLFVQDSGFYLFIKIYLLTTS